MTTKNSEKNRIGRKHGRKLFGHVFSLNFFRYISFIKARKPQDSITNPVVFKWQGKKASNYRLCVLCRPGASGDALFSMVSVFCCPMLSIRVAEKMAENFFIGRKLFRPEIEVTAGPSNSRRLLQ